MGNHQGISDSSVSISVGIENPPVPSPQGVQRGYRLALALFGRDCTPLRRSQGRPVALEPSYQAGNARHSWGPGPLGPRPRGV